MSNIFILLHYQMFPNTIGEQPKNEHCRGKIDKRQNNEDAVAQKFWNKSHISH